MPSPPSLFAHQVVQLRGLGMGDQFLQQLGREGFLVCNLEQLTHPADAQRISRSDSHMLHGIAGALLHGGPGIPEDAAPRSHYVETSRPVRMENGHDYLKARFRLFDPSTPTVGNLTVVRGDTPHFVPPPNIELSTQDYFDVLQMLEYAGVHYTDPRSPAAGDGFSTFLAGRHYVLERLSKLEGTGQERDWIGFDWDFTADAYRIYGELAPLISLKMFQEPPRNADKKFIRVLEAAKPGMHELMVGMMAGYAIHQGLLLFSQWEHYQPSVRVVTQTWAQRLMVLGNEHMRLLPFMMGRLPGLPMDITAVVSSPAFITLHDFLREADRLLDAYVEAGCRFDALAARERNDLIAILRTGKGHVVKSMGAFEASAWPPPSLMFDDGPVTNEHMARSGVQVVQVPNPLAPGKEMSDLKVVTVRGRSAAFRQMIAMLSNSETASIVNHLTDLLKGAPRIDLWPSDTSPTPEGTVVVMHDTRRSLDRFFEEFEAPKRRLKRKIKDTLKQAGGLSAAERDYRDAMASLPLEGAS